MTVLKVYQRRARVLCKTVKNDELNKSSIKVYKRRARHFTKTSEPNKECSWFPHTRAKPSLISHIVLNSEVKAQVTPICSEENEGFCNVGMEDLNKVGYQDKQICNDASQKDLDSTASSELNGGVGDRDAELEKIPFTDSVETLDSKDPANSTTQGAVEHLLENGSVPVGSNVQNNADAMTSLCFSQCLTELNGGADDGKVELVQVPVTDCVETLDSKGPLNSNSQGAIRNNLQNLSDATGICVNQFAQANVPDYSASLTGAQDANEQTENAGLKRRRLKKYKRRFRPRVTVKRKIKKASQPRTPKPVTPRHPSYRKRKYESESCEETLNEVDAKRCKRELGFDLADQPSEECMITRSTYQRKIQEDLCLHISRQCGSSFPRTCKKVRRRRRRRLNTFFMHELSLGLMETPAKGPRSRRLSSKCNIPSSDVTWLCNLENPLRETLSRKKEEAKIINELDMITDTLFNDNHKKRLVEGYCVMEPYIVSKCCDEKREGRTLEAEKLLLPSSITDSLDFSRQEIDDYPANKRILPECDDPLITTEPRDGRKNISEDFISRLRVPNLNNWAEKVGLAGRPQQKPKKKKHRPRVIVEGILKKTPKPRTPNSKTPERANARKNFGDNCFPEGVIDGNTSKKRKYERRSSKNNTVPINKTGTKPRRRLDFDQADQPREEASQEAVQEEKKNYFFPKNSFVHDHVTPQSNGFWGIPQEGRTGPVSLQSMCKPREFWFSLESRDPQEELQKHSVDSFTQMKPLELKDLEPITESGEELLQERGDSSVSQKSLVKYNYFQDIPRSRCAQMLKDRRAKRREVMKINYIVRLLKRIQVSDKCSKPVKEILDDLGHGSGHGVIVPYQGPKKPTKVKSIIAKVDLDEETLREWNLIMNIDDGRAREEEAKAEEQENWRRREREIFKGRIDSFTARMHLILGDRRFTAWKGSVVDSVVGVFLTQNVSDNLSSSAYMSLAARFPLNSKNENKEGNESVPNNQESTGSHVPFISEVYDLVGNMYFVTDPEPGSNDEPDNKTMPSDSEDEVYDCLEDECKTSTRIDYGNPISNLEIKNVGTDDITEPHDCFEPLVSRSGLEDYRSLMQHNLDSAITSEKILEASSVQGEETKRTPKKKNEKEKVQIDWESKRRMYYSSKPESSDHMDSVDWEAVRCADVGEIAKAIKDRGQQNQIAQRIKDFLNRLVELHGNIDLEWLRNAPPDEVKDYLLEIPGLGLKSVECVRLLCLQNVAFPVDTNVGRIAVRLGWVPLQPLPEQLQIHLLDQYPLMDSIQKYLWPRLSHLDQRTLYELHYQMITFGKVFCKKRNPNCGACPLRGECKHFASAFASARLALPGPLEKGMVPFNVPNVPEGNSSVAVDRAPMFLLEAGPHSQSAYQTGNLEPIIEEPASPPPQECPMTPEQDLEDFCSGEMEDIPTIKLQEREFQENLQKFMETNNVMLHDSQALVALTAEAASYSVPKLKNISRLRTEHMVYVLPDNHNILQGFWKREPDDPCPYLLVIWTPGETSDSYEAPKTKCSAEEGKLCRDQTCYLCSRIREQYSDVVRGTILIPSRTANRGRFPLNGTYFQVNEVFADHETSLKPIYVPRNQIANLPTQTAYFGTSTTSVLNALDIGGIQKCFWRGFICVRGFDRKYHAPRPLSRRLHCPPSKIGKPNAKSNDE